MGISGRGTGPCQKKSRNKMKAVFSLLALALAASSVQANVVDLTDSDFDSELEGMDTALVMFYAPWCGHCKKMKPEFDRASKDLLANDPPVTLAKIDCTEAGKDTCNRFEVRGYPTVKICRGGEVSQDYNGPRDAAGIVKYMKAQVGPASKELTTDADLTALLAKTKEVVVVANLEDSAKMDAFQEVASKMRESNAFAHSASTSDVRKAGVYLHRPKHLQSKFEAAALKYDGDMDKVALEAFIKDNYHGLVGHKTFDNAADFKGDVVTAFYAVDYEKNVKGTNYWRNRVMKVAKDFEGLTFSVASKHDFAQELAEYGLDSRMSEDKPLVAVKSADGKKYVMEEEFSMDALKKFLGDFQAGSLEPHMKSEPVPDNSAPGVKVAVAKNFDELVTNTEKDVLVEFYAPWCGHCKKLAPVYDELGEKMADEAVEIVKMDATANDVPSTFEVRGFPTIFWVQKGSKPVAYNGGREVDDFVKYIAKHATNELKGFDRNGKAKKTEL